MKDSWLWTVAEPAVAVLCACLPTWRPLIANMFGSVLSLYSSKKSEGLKDPNLVAAGGRLSKPPSKSRFAKSSGKGTEGSFERLNDVENPREIPEGLWPRGYRADRETTVVGTDSHSALSDEIALNAIHVRNEVCLSETTVQR